MVVVLLQKCNVNAMRIFPISAVAYVHDTCNNNKNGNAVLLSERMYFAFYCANATLYVIDISCDIFLQNYAIFRAFFVFFVWERVTSCLANYVVLCNCAYNCMSHCALMPVFLCEWTISSSTTCAVLHNCACFSLHINASFSGGQMIFSATKCALSCSRVSTEVQTLQCCIATTRFKSSEQLWTIYERQYTIFLLKLHWSATQVCMTMGHNLARYIVNYSI